MDHIAVHRAGDLPGKTIRPLEITIQRSIEAKLDNDCTPEQIMRRDAERLAEALRRVLPKCTLEALAVRLMERMVSGLTRAAE